MRIHSINISEVDGPGKRIVIHTQGCFFKCPFCFNKQTWSINGGEKINKEDLLKKIEDKLTNDVRGITFSGGEPTLYTEEICNLVDALKKKFLDLDFFVYTGLDDITNHPFTQCFDAIKYGKYDHDLKTNQHYIASSNQQILFCTDKINDSDFDVNLKTQITINKNNEITILGFIEGETICQK